MWTCFCSRPKLDWRFVQRLSRILEILFPSWSNQSVRMFMTLLGVTLSGMTLLTSGLVTACFVFPRCLFNVWLLFQFSLWFIKWVLFQVSSTRFCLRRTMGSSKTWCCSRLCSFWLIQRWVWSVIDIVFWKSLWATGSGSKLLNVLSSN